MPTLAKEKQNRARQIGQGIGESLSLECLRVAFKWFDWWGGWSFGYRPIVDTMPLLAVLILPAIDTILESRFWTKIMFAAALTWSIAVQVTGAFAYDLVGWNARLAVQLPGNAVPMPLVDERDVLSLQRRYGKGLKIVRLNIDRPQYRHRLWSISDNQILYYMSNFTRSRINKRRTMERWIRSVDR